MIRWTAVLLVVALGGCKEESGPPAPRYVEEGDPCHTDFGKRCVDDAHLLHCVDRSRTTATCDAVCAAQSPAFVSGACVQEDYGEACVCVLADPDGCTPGDFRCTDTETIGKCDDTQQWVDHACADLCPEGQPSLGCRGEPVQGVPLTQGAAACVCGL